MSEPAILLIGGLDPQGCAGIAADLATIRHHGRHALALVTAVTAQSAGGLTAMGAIRPDALLAQYQGCVADFSIGAIKIGLLPDLAIAQAVLHILEQHTDIPVVLDPVLGSTSGGLTVADDVLQFMVEKLFPRLSLLTPNLAELQRLTMHSDPEAGATTLRGLGLAACLVKGGHAAGDYASDYFLSAHSAFYCYRPKYPIDVRGTGCVLASALAVQLAAGEDIRDAVVLAKAYVSRGIRLAHQAGPYQVIAHASAAPILEDLPSLCYRHDLIGRHLEFAPCPPRLGIYPVIDSCDWLKKLVAEGIPTIQLRVKEKSAQQTQQQIEAAVAHLAGREVCLFVNDHWQQAMAAGAYGVHLGQDDLHDANLQLLASAGLRLGVSTHSWWELARALSIRPSYIALGPIYPTSSKQMPFAPQGIERLRQWVELLHGHYPLVAIGGINRERGGARKASGGGAIAMITAITQAEDYRQATRELIELWR